MYPSCFVSIHNSIPYRLLPCTTIATKESIQIQQILKCCVQANRWLGTWQRQKVPTKTTSILDKSPGILGGILESIFWLRYPCKSGNFNLLENHDLVCIHIDSHNFTKIIQIRVYYQWDYHCCLEKRKRCFISHRMFILDQLDVKQCDKVYIRVIIIGICMGKQYAKMWHCIILDVIWVSVVIQKMWL